MDEKKKPAERKRYAYYILDHLTDALSLPSGVLVVYNYFLHTKDTEKNREIKGYVLFDHALTGEEQRKYKLMEAPELDDMWI
jgi:hypothetical protein